MSLFPQPLYQFCHIALILLRYSYSSLHPHFLVPLRHSCSFLIYQVLKCLVTILQKNVYIIVIIVILPLLTEDGTISSISSSNFIKSRNINSQNLCEKHETSARKFVKKFLKYPSHNQKQNFQQHILIEKKKQMEDRINGWSLMRVNNPLRPPFPFTFHPPPISLIFHTSWPPFFLSLHSSLGFFSFLRRFARPAAFFTGRPVISSWSRTSHTYLPPPNLSSLCIGTRRRRRKAFV